MQRLVLANPVRLHLALALDFNISPRHRGDVFVWILRLEQLQGAVGAMNAVLHGMAFHPRGCIDSVAKETVSRVSRPHDVGNHRPRMKAYSDGDRTTRWIFDGDGSSVGHLHSIDGKLRNPLRVILLLVHKVTACHVRIADGFDLEYVVLFGQIIEGVVQAVKEVRDLKRRHGRCKRGETNDVAEEYGHQVMRFRLDLASRLQRFCNMRRENAVEQLVRVMLRRCSLPRTHRCSLELRINFRRIALLEVLIEFFECRTLAWILPQASSHQRTDALGGFAWNARSFANRWVHDEFDHFVVVLVFVRIGSGIDFIQDDTKGVHICGCVVRSLLA
mmetsp:Transcript_10640/g.29367  ORF Transcript_10640/g.29367 Transcript_10640/m.29367 type:complete len:332 (+) Transcript_10640:778-1773(+)